MTTLQVVAAVTGLVLTSAATIAGVLFGVWRMFAHYEARNDAAHRDLGMRIDATNERIDGLKTDLVVRIDRVNADLGARIDRVNADLGARIDRVSTDLGARIDRTNERIDRTNERIDGMQSSSMRAATA